MIDCIFTLDYEIYGNGHGSLTDLVYEPSARLAEVFHRAGARFVPFVEAAEFEMIGAAGTDPAIDLVERQIRQFHEEGFTPALHLHPQWYGARYDRGQWILNYDEYNLCTLPRERIVHIVDRSIAYLRRVVGEAAYQPLAFRAGNWLFQPSQEAGAVLFERGVRVDSSVFKGGVRHEHQLDYRPALRNGYYWRFDHSADVAEPAGRLLEMPIYTKMVPFWQMSSAKRFVLERQNLSNGTLRKKLYRLQDIARVWHPLKFDFCRMSLEEMTGMMDAVLADDRHSPGTVRPVVAIGHSKELVDLKSIAGFLDYLNGKGIAISTFDDVYPRCA